jgi:hypothetical protein
VNELEKATVRACLDQAMVALAEAREEWVWWESKSAGVKRQWQEFESLVGSLRRSEELK